MEVEVGLFSFGPVQKTIDSCEVPCVGREDHAGGAPLRFQLMLSPCARQRSHRGRGRVGGEDEEEMQTWTGFENQDKLCEQQPQASERACLVVLCCYTRLVSMISNTSSSAPGPSGSGPPGTCMRFFSLARRAHEA